MLRSPLRRTTLAFLVLLACPRTGSAHWLDIIIEMSGPQMIGAIFLHCNVEVTGGPPECRVIDRQVAGPERLKRDRKAWFGFDAIAYTSTDKNSNGDDYRAFRNHMVAIEPMLEVRVLPETRGWTFYHGLAGLSVDYLFGSGVSDYDSFWKTGLKFRPIAANYRGWDVAFNFRVYPDAFTRDQFGFGTPLPEGTNRPVERVYGFSVGHAW